jgi:hypothetical protein
MIEAIRVPKRWVEIVLHVYNSITSSGTRTRGLPVVA